jgi:hypothetical protein
MKILFPIFALAFHFVNISAAAPAFFIRDRLENYIDNPDFNALSCSSEYSLHDYIFVIAKKRNEFGGPVGLFYDHRGPNEKNILLEVTGLPQPYNQEWKSFRSFSVEPGYGIKNGRYWFVMKWSDVSGSELLPDFEIRVFMQRPIPYLYPTMDNLASILKCKLKN